MRVLAATLAIAIAPSPDTIVFAPRDGHAVGKRFQLATALEFDAGSIEFVGHGSSPAQARRIWRVRTLELHDVHARVEDGRPPDAVFTQGFEGSLVLDALVD